MKLVAQELTIHAPAELLYELLTDPELFVQWMADEATLDPRPDGVVRWTHANGDTCSGRVRRARPGATGRVHLRLGTRRRRDPARVDDRRDRPHPDRRDHHGAAARSPRSRRSRRRRAPWRMDPLPRSAATPGRGCAARARTRSSRNVSRRLSSCGHDERRDRRRRGTVLDARRATPRSCRRDPLDDDGPAVPAVRRSVLRLLRSSHRQPPRQARRIPGRRARRSWTRPAVRPGGPTIPRMGRHPLPAVTDLESLCSTKPSTSSRPTPPHQSNRVVDDVHRISRRRQTFPPSTRGGPSTTSRLHRLRLRPLGSGRGEVADRRRCPTSRQLRRVRPGSVPVTVSLIRAPWPVPSANSTRTWSPGPPVGATSNASTRCSSTSVIVPITTSGAMYGVSGSPTAGAARCSPVSRSLPNHRSHATSAGTRQLALEAHRPTAVRLLSPRAGRDRTRGRAPRVGRCRGRAAATARRRARCEGRPGRAPNRWRSSARRSGRRTSGSTRTSCRRRPARARTSAGRHPT